MELGYQLWSTAQDPLSAPRLLLLHGMGGTGALWRPIAASLENDFAVLAVDQRGHGKSRVSASPAHREPPSYAPLAYGQDVVDTLRALQFHPTWVLGHSMGVRTAVAFAHLQPTWCQGLILVDLGFSGVAGGGLGEGLAHFLKVLPMHFSSRAEAREFMARECPDPSIAQYLLAVSVPSDLPGGLTFPFDRSALIETIYAARDSSVRTWIEALGAQGLPILVLRGAQSLVWNREEYLAEAKALSRFPQIRFQEIPGAGHGLPFEKRLEFVSCIRDFMRQSQEPGHRSR